MLRTGALIWTFALLTLAAVSSAALAGQFSTPVPLPRSEQEAWRFAVNDRGQAIAARFSDGDRVLVYPVARSGRLGRPWHLAVPGFLIRGDRAPAVALNGRGRVAVALSVEETRPGPAEHSLGSGEHVAIASWQLGAKPPALQVLTPEGDEASYSEGQLTPPEVVIGRTSITAIWAAGGRAPVEGIIPANVDEAYGSVGGQLRAVKLATVADGDGTVT
ncbi:MAG: hypothetical protein ACRDJX_04485, partial [Solirubrobacteraceae bacterium]